MTNKVGAKHAANKNDNYELKTSKENNNKSKYI